MPGTSDKPLAYKPERVAKMIDVSVSTIYRMVENGTIPHKRLSSGEGTRGRIIIPADALRKWINKTDKPRQVIMQKKAEQIARDAVRKLRSVK